MKEQPSDLVGTKGEGQAPEPPEEIEPSLLQLLGKGLLELGETVLPAIVIAVLINLFLAQATRVYGSSMEPSLYTDQRLVVEKVSYRLHMPKRGDIVVLRIPERGPELLIKRVIALPGEQIEVREGHVYVDGKSLEEPYIAQPTRGQYGPLVVPDGQVFVMGDNRGASNDSRAFGPVPLENVVGRAWVSYWPLGRVGMVH